MTSTIALADTTPEELEAVLAAAAAAAPAWADTRPAERARVLNGIADALAAAAGELVPIAMRETGLPEGRLTGEVTRTAVQLRMFADLLDEGAFLDVVLDRADPDFVLGPRPDLRLYQIPVGPVLVFAASNFPFAFSVTGGDSASALAAGCPVVLKTHPGHPETSAATARVVAAALRETGTDPGVFAVINGQQAGVDALRDARIAASGFTGSVAGGRALFDVAASRPVPIPFFGELGSVNPAVVTAAALAERAEEIVAGFVDSFTLGAGQFCTKPGLLLVPSGTAVADGAAPRVAGVPAARLLTDRIAAGFEQRIDETVAVEGVQVLVRGGRHDDGAAVPSLTPTLLRASAETVLAHPETLLEESFGPAALIVDYTDIDQVRAIIAAIGGSLTVTLQTSTAMDEAERDDVRSIVAAATVHSGRIVFNGWPTGVAVTPAQHHGGPYPATTAIATTSVGTAAVRRFLRPVAFQNAPDSVLPEPLREGNPLGVPRTVNEAGLSPRWGRLHTAR